MCVCVDTCIYICYVFDIQTMPQKDEPAGDDRCAFSSPLQEIQNAAVVTSLEQRFLVIKQAILEKIDASS